MKRLVAFFIGVSLFAWVIFIAGLYWALWANQWDRGAFFLVLAYYVRQVGNDAAINAQGRLQEWFDEDEQEGEI